MGQNRFEDNVADRNLADLITLLTPIMLAFRYRFLTWLRWMTETLVKTST